MCPQKIVIGGGDKIWIRGSGKGDTFCFGYGNQWGRLVIPDMSPLWCTETEDVFVTVIGDWGYVYLYIERLTASQMFSLEIWHADC